MPRTPKCDPENHGFEGRFSSRQVATDLDSSACGIYTWDTRARLRRGVFLPQPWYCHRS